MFHAEYLLRDKYCLKIYFSFLEINLSNFEGVTQINNYFMIIFRDTETTDIVVKFIGF